MLKYIIKRLLHMIPVLFIISVVIFGIIKAMPGDPVNAYLGPGSQVSAEQRDKIRHLLGLDQPIYIQYGKWLGRMCKGEFGDSFTYRMPVSKVIPEFIWNSFILNILAFVVGFIVSVIVGVICAVKRYSVFDNFWTVFSLVRISIPSFFFALLLIFIFSIKFQWLPIGGKSTPGLEGNSITHGWDVFRHMILPATVIGLATLADNVRYVRNAMLEVLKQDYVRTARSKGVAEWLVIFKHAFRNGLIPIVTLIGLYIPTLFSGSVLLETVFCWPGIGYESYNALMSRDYNLAMTLMMFIALLTLVGFLLSDILYSFVDPRVKCE